MVAATTAFAELLASGRAEPKPPPDRMSLRRRRDESLQHEDIAGPSKRLKQSPAQDHSGHSVHTDNAVDESVQNETEQDPLGDSVHAANVMNESLPRDSCGPQGESGMLGPDVIASSDALEPADQTQSSSPAIDGLTRILAHYSLPDDEDAPEQDIAEQDELIPDDEAMPIPEPHATEDIDYDSPDSSQDDDEFLPDQHESAPHIHIDHLKDTQAFIDMLKNATLESDGLHPDVLERLRHPPAEPLKITDDIRLSLEIYLGIDRAADEVYNLVRKAVGRPPHNITMLSLDQVKRTVLELSGVYPLYRDMCPESCAAFTGPWAKLEKCPSCGADRFDQEKLKLKGIRVPRKQCLTNPVGPMIQAFHRSVQSATAMHYRRQSTEKMMNEFRANGNRINIQVFQDVIHGSEYWSHVLSGNICGWKDIVLLLSLDGAQLYRMKQSDCWIYIWILLDMAPETRYKEKNVLVGGVIPGPNKPKHMESFLFPGMHHIAALMRDNGFQIWDAKLVRSYTADLFVALICADGPGLSEINGFMEHSGQLGCRLYCGMQSRLKPDTGIYYPVSLKPNEPYDVPRSAHPDVAVGQRPPSQAEIIQAYNRNLRILLESHTVTAYRKHRLATGIAKQTILSGLPSNRIFSIPGCFTMDIMHLDGINIPQLCVALWRGTMDCSSDDSKATWDWAIFSDSRRWQEHGRDVEMARQYLPGSFDRPPRNIQEKLTSGYKCVEFETWLYGYCPGFLYKVLPDRYWINLCKLVRGVRIVSQRSITMDQLVETKRLIDEFVQEYENLYYQRKPTRIHFVRPCIHGLTHTITETIHIAPCNIFSQRPMERLIGSLGAEIRQPSKPFANLARRALRRCQMNAIKAMVPDLAPPPQLPTGAVDLGDGYVLLRAAEAHERRLPHAESAIIAAFVRNIDGDHFEDSFIQMPMIAKWARLQLPNGQIVRSWWKERLGLPRTSRNVKISRDGQTQFAEVQYFFKLALQPDKPPEAFAMVSIYSLPDADLLQQSSGALWSCQHQGEHALQVIPVKAIEAVVAMIPHPHNSDPEVDAQLSGRVFVVEKLGLDVLGLLAGDAEDPNVDSI